MRYKEYGQTGKQVSSIGFGGMRLPDPHHHEHGVALIHKAYQAGINYFDTAPYYCDDQSEDIFGEALRTMPRGDLPVYTSSKCQASDGAQFRSSLERSLERLGVPQITFFHIWCVMDPQDWQQRVNGGALAAALKAKEEGLIGHVCVSTHMTGAEIAALMEAYPKIEGYTLGYCAINFPYRRAGVAAAHRHHKGVVCMNPLSGGLIPQRPDAFDFLRAEDDTDVVTAALRFLLSDEAVTTALIGFSEPAHIDAAVRVMNGFLPYPQSHYDRLERAIHDNFNALCTGCGYCLPCPQNILIPKYMDVCNYLQLGAVQQELRDRLKFHWDLTTESAKECIQCGLCESRCTQHLPIIERLQQLCRAVD